MPFFKNTILKHLSKFTKNLTPDQINVSTLKGEGELNNLELDEDILMELLDLPTWLRLKKAVCNRVNFKIAWTKLKSQPICLYLDEVILELETCEEPRQFKTSQQAGNGSEGSYGFADRVVDGMYVHINSVSMKCVSKMFQATLQLSRVIIQSLLPNWKKPHDLHGTRIRDTNRGEILIFKEASWQTTRIEAVTSEGEAVDPMLLTPLRFIANQSKIRITLKKKLSDCSVIATRVMLFLDDILWVLTDTQLKAAMLYLSSLEEMMQKSAEQRKRLAADKLQRQMQYSQAIQQQQASQQRSRSQSNASKLAQLFTRYDVQSTSYHLITSRVDLHLCDDTKPYERTNQNPEHNSRIEGGAMQITLWKLSLDIYPFNPAGGERKHWYRYTDNQGSRNFWVQQLFSTFKTEVNKARETCRPPSPSTSPASGTKPNKPTPAENKQAPGNQTPNKSPSNQPSPQQKAGKPRTTKLLESCYVMKLEEFCIYQVSTADNKRNTPKKFLCSDKKQLHLPSDMSVIHCEFTEYFFPEGIDYPVPHPNLYVLVNPVRLHVDYLTVLWSNYFFLSLYQNLPTETEDKSQEQHVDIKVEALMPRIIAPAEKKVESQPDRPEGIQLQVSKLVLTNTHNEEKTSLKHLQELLQSYKEANLFTSNSYPNNNNDVQSIPPHFQVYANGEDNPYLFSYSKDLISGKLPSGFSCSEETISKLLKTHTLKKNAKMDLWCLIADQVWLEFVNMPGSKTRPISFVESVPLTLWFCEPDEIDSAMTQQTTPDFLSLNSAGKPGLNPKYPSQDGESLPSERDQRRTRKLLKDYYSSDSESNTTSVDESSSAHKQDRKTSLKLAQYNIIAKIGGTVKAHMNHFQYLFLMRLLDSFSKFQSQLTADIDQFLGAASSSSSSSNNSSFSIPLIVPELEFVMISPYIAELLPFSHVAGDSGANSVHGGECTEGEEEEEEEKVDAINLGDLVDDHGQLHIETKAKELGNHTDEVLDEPMSPVSSAHSTISKSQSDSHIHCHGTGPQIIDPSIPGESTLLVASHISHSSQVLTTTHADTAVHGYMPPGYSGLDSSYNPHGPTSNQMKKSATKAADHMKKSFTSALSNISGFTDKIKAKIDSSDELSIPDDSDSVSIKTDTSDEDFDFEILTQDDVDLPAFHSSRHFNSETASSTDTELLEQDDMSSIYAESSTATKGKELISVITFKIFQGEVLLQNDGANTSVRIQAKHLCSQQPGNMYYDDFYTKYSTTSGICTEKREKDPNAPFTVMMKMMIGLDDVETGKDREGGEEKSNSNYMSVKANQSSLQFTTSSLTNMAKFVEEEQSGDSMPLHVTVSNFQLTLEDDAPKQKQEKQQPVHLMIHTLSISRGQDGVFHLASESLEPLAPVLTLTTEEMDSSVTEAQELSASENEGGDAVVPNNLITENEKLRKSLQDMVLVVKQQTYQNQKLQQEMQDMENARNENQILQAKLKQLSSSVENNSIDNAYSLKKDLDNIVSENLNLQQKLTVQEDEIASLNKEKESLLATLKLLQDELLASESRQQRGPRDFRH